MRLTVNGEQDEPASARAPARVALITGATAGMGSVFAERLAAAGHDLVLVARDAARLEARATQLRSAHGVRVQVIAADLGSSEGLARVVSHVECSPVDMLVNNAGFGTTGVFADTDAAAQERMVRLHVIAVNALTRAALPAMQQRRSGAIVTVASVASYLTSPGNANYCATKTYQRVLMESIAIEMAGSGVYIQALCPGFTRTEFHERAAIDMSRIPAVLWTSADEVVDTSLAAVARGGPTVVIPGRIYRIILFLVRNLPRALVSRATRVYRRDRQVR